MTAVITSLEPPRTLPVAPHTALQTTRHIPAAHRPSASASTTTSTSMLFEPLVVGDLTGTTVRVVPWRDDVTERNGHDPRSPYVERFWLSILGPSATWLVRSLSWGLDSCPDGFGLSLTDMAKALGLGDKLGRHSPFVKALHRSCQFDLTALDDSHPSGMLLLRTRRQIPWLSKRMTLSLPDALRAEHQLWVQSATQDRMAKRSELRTVQRITGD